MAEKDFDNLFRELGNDKPYYGSWEWFENMQKSRRIREQFQECQQREKTEKEEAIRAKWTRREYPFGLG